MTSKNCNTKCWPKGYYNPIQHISEMGSSRSAKMQMANKIIHASKHRGRCSKKVIKNNAAFVISAAPQNNFYTAGRSSNGKNSLSLVFL